MLKERLSGMLQVQKDIRKELKRVHSGYFWGEQIDQMVFALPEKKLDNIGVRGYFVRKVYDYIQAQAKMEGMNLRSDLPAHWFEVSLPFLAEVIISLQYYHNQILDRKGGVTTPETINSNLIAANLLRSFINSYIRDTFGDDTETMLTVQNTVEKILIYVDVGQYMDKNWGTYECFVNGLPENTWLGEEIEAFINSSVIDWIWKEIHSSGIPNEHERFVRLYLKRIYLTNASLFILMANLFMHLLCYENKFSIIHFSAYCAISLQLMNDNIDFAKPDTVAKCSSDDCSDLRNATITLPILYAFNSSQKSPIAKGFFNGNHILSDVLEEVVFYIFNYSKPTSENIAKNSYQYLDEKNIEYNNVIDLLSVIFSNKYYNYLAEN
jgi:geranylgeranyl pyrophosphate synthase